MLQSRVDTPRNYAGFDAARAHFTELFARIDPSRETLFVAYLDEGAQCISISEHQGDVTGVIWPVRLILLEAARRHCTGIVVAHNHPSGDATPSAADREATRRLAIACEAIDVTLVDHLVFAGDRCTSFRRTGLV